MAKAKDVTVSVTEQDIKKGIKGDPCKCPVARALKRAFHERNISAGAGFMFVGPPKRRISWRTPEDVTTFIERFDEELKVKPIEFSLPTKSTYSGTILPEPKE